MSGQRRTHAPVQHLASRWPRDTRRGPSPLHHPQPAACTVTINYSCSPPLYLEVFISSRNTPTCALCDSRQLSQWNRLEYRYVGFPSFAVGADADVEEAGSSRLRPKSELASVPKWRSRARSRHVVALPGTRSKIYQGTRPCALIHSYRLLQLGLFAIVSTWIVLICLVHVHPHVAHVACAKSLGATRRRTVCLVSQLHTWQQFLALSSCTPVTGGVGLCSPPALLVSYPAVVLVQ